MTNIQNSRKVYAALDHQNRFNNIIYHRQYNRSTEHNMVTSLAEKMFRKSNPSLLRGGVVNQFFCVLLSIVTLCDPRVGHYE